MACPSCTGADSSIFELTCIDCGVRLVKSARSAADPKTAKRMQNGHLAHIEHCAGAKVKEQVVARLRGEA